MAAAGSPEWWSHDRRVAQGVARVEYEYEYEYEYEGEGKDQRRKMASAMRAPSRAALTMPPA
jgi:hypothetical protein